MNKISTGLNRTATLCIIRNNDKFLLLKRLKEPNKDMLTRPIYHRKQRRIEAHICIAFVAYKVYKELERQLKQREAKLRPEKAIDIAKTIYAVKIVHPITQNITYSTIIKTEEQVWLAKIFDF